MTRYRLLAVDVDGTLVGRDHRVSERNAQALRAARRAGLTVCLCTGRTHIEAQPVWRECNLPGKADPMICIGGAAIAESDTGRSLHINPIHPEDVLAAGRHLGEMGYCVAAVIDRWRWGFDCFLTEGRDREVVWRDWFSKHPCTAREVESLDAVHTAGKLPEVLRLTVLLKRGEAVEAEAAFRAQFGSGPNGRGLEIVRIFAPNYGIEVLECFGRGVTKWSGISYVAQGLRVSPRDVVAVGDDVNDVPMLQHAGLGVAMGNAPPPVQQVARHVAGLHTEDGLADFVDQLLDGVFDK